MDGEHQDNREDDDHDLHRREHQPAGVDDWARVLPVGGGVEADDRKQDIGDHQRCRESDDHHPDQIRPLALEGRVEHAVEEEGEHRPDGGGEDQRHPDRDPGSV